MHFRLRPLLARYFSGQLFAADPSKLRQVFPDEFPHHRRCDALAIVAEHIADACYLRPWNFRVPGFQLVGQMPAGLGNDFDAAFHQPALAPVSLESIERHAFRLAADVLDRLEDVGEARGERGRGH